MAFSKYFPLESLRCHPVFYQMNRFYMLDEHSAFMFLDRYPPYAFGRNSGYRLGLGHDNNVFVFPESIPNLENHEIESISNAGNHVCALTKTGQVFVWGSDPLNRIIHKKPSWLSCSNSVIKVVCSFWFRLILQSDGISLIYSIDEQKYSQSIHNSIDIGCTSDRYLILKKDSIISDVYRTEINLIVYLIDSWLQIKQLICGKHKILLLSAAKCVYRCEFNPNRTIFHEKLDIKEEIIQGYGSIQHNTFVLVDQQQHCHVWNGDTDKMFHTKITSVPEAFMQFEISFTSNMIKLHA